LTSGTLQLEELGGLYADAAVIVETPPSEAVQRETLLQDHLVLPMPLSAPALLEDLEAALSRPVVRVQNGIMGKEAS